MEEMTLIKWQKSKAVCGDRRYIFVIIVSFGLLFFKEITNISWQTEHVTFTIYILNILATGWQSADQKRTSYKLFKHSKLVIDCRYFSFFVLVDFVVRAGSGGPTGVDTAAITNIVLLTVRTAGIVIVKFLRILIPQRLVEIHEDIAVSFVASIPVKTNHVSAVRDLNGEVTWQR